MEWSKMEHRKANQRPMKRNGTKQSEMKSNAVDQWMNLNQWTNGKGIEM